MILNKLVIVIKNFFKGWNWFEYLLLAVSFAAPVAIGIVFKSSFLEICASIVTLLVTLLFAKAKIEGYFLVFLQLALYMVVTYQAKLYGEMIICLAIELPVVIYGIVNWLKNKHNDSSKGRVVKIGHTGILEVAILFASQAVLGVGFYFMLRAFDTQFVVVSTFSVCTAIIGVYLVARRSQLGLFGWILNDIALITLWSMVVAGGSATSAVMLVIPCVCFVNDVYGTVAWNLLKRKQKAEAGIKIEKMNFKKKTHREFFKKFYDEIFCIAFPDPNEAESFESLVSYYVNGGGAKGRIVDFDVYLAFENGEVCGGLLADVFKRTNTSLMTYVVVSPAHQRKGIAKKLIDTFVLQSGVDTVFFEVENPDKMPADMKEKCETRVKIWEKLGGKKIGIDYVQPPLQDDKKAVEVLDLFYIGKQADNKTILSFIEDFFNYCLSCNEKTKQYYFEFVKKQLG